MYIALFSYLKLRQQSYLPKLSKDTLHHKMLIVDQLSDFDSQRMFYSSGLVINLD